MSEIDPLLRIGTTTAERTAAREDDHKARVREVYARHIAYGGERTREVQQQLVRGEWIFYWSPVIEQLKREGRMNEALELAIECADCAERTLGYGPMWGWVKKVAIIARKMGRYDYEVEVLETFLSTAWYPERHDDARVRLTKARALVARNK